MNITKLSLKRPVTTMMIFISFVVIGLISSRLVPLEYFPDISFPGAFISIPYNNSTPEEVEQNITRPVEEAISTISGLEEISSTSSENQAGIFVRFKMGSDISLKALEVKEKIDGVRSQLPEDMERVIINKFSAQDNPMMTVRISSERDLSDAYDLLNRNLKQRIERINGVAKVDLYGVDKKQIRIELIPERLEAHRVNINELAQRLRQSNFSMTAGKVDESGKRYTVRPIGEIRTADGFEELVIGPKNLRIKDIATVLYDTPERDYGRHLDQKYAIGLDIFKESGANTVAVGNRVMEEIDAVNKLPEMRGINMYEMNNQATGIISSLLELLKAGLLGGLFSILVLYFFLRKVSTTLIVALAVPFSLIVTLGMLYFLDLSLNILSMMGLMLAIGMLVDNAVVVTESIHQNQQKMDDAKSATLSGTQQVGMAVTAGTLTTIIVFLPNIVSELSMIAVQLYHVAISIIIALVASLLISLTIIPLLTARIKPPQKSSKKRFIDKMEGWYGNLLGWLMNHRYTTSLLIFGTFLSVIIPMQFMEVDMFPNDASRELYLQYNLNDTYTLEQVEKTVDVIEDYLYSNKENFEIESVYSYYQPQYAQSTIILTDDDEAEKDVQLIKKKIEEKLPAISTGAPSFEFNSQNNSEQVSVFLIGESSEVLVDLSDEVIRRLGALPGFTDVRSEAEAGAQEVQLVVDRQRARNFGLTSQDIAGVVSSSMRGMNLRRVRGQEGEIDVILALQDSDRQTLDNLRNLPINVSGDQAVKLASLADLHVRRGPRTIQRQDRQTSLGITVNLDDITMDEAREQIAGVMDQMSYPAGYGWSYGRSFANDQQAMDEMIINMLLAMFLIYMVMASLFESVLFPSSIITCIFFGIIGVLWFFFLTGTTFSFMAMIGILILMGIVVNNGIVLIDHINHLRANGLDRKQAIIQGGRDRMRPILMTAATTVLGLIPLCLGTTQIGGDGPPYYPMARAIVGGLTFSTVITLIILPSIYIILDDIKRWSGRILHHSRID